MGFRMSAGAALAAAVVVLTSGTAHAGPGWEAPALPVTGNGALLGVTRVDSHISWAYGIGVTKEGRAERHSPLLLSYDDRKSAAGRREVPVPAFGETSNRISSVSAVSAREPPGSSSG